MHKYIYSKIHYTYSVMYYVQAMLLNMLYTVHRIMYILNIL